MESIQKTVRESLWQELVSDPNNIDGLTLWIEDHERHGGDQGALDALRKAAALPGSWLANIWTTRVLLSEGKLQESLAIYEEALKLAPAESLAFQEISGHLGEAGYYREAVEFLLPRYDPESQGVFAGLNLFNLCEDADDLDAAQQVLILMRRGNWPEYRPILRIRQEKLNILRELKKTEPRSN